jgi:hypothetical protein
VTLIFPAGVAGGRRGWAAGRSGGRRPSPRAPGRPRSRRSRGTRPCALPRGGAWIPAAARGVSAGSASPLGRAAGRGGAWPRATSPTPPAKTYALTTSSSACCAAAGSPRSGRRMDSGEEGVVAMREDFQRLMATRSRELIEDLTGRRVGGLSEPGARGARFHARDPSSSTARSTASARWRSPHRGVGSRLERQADSRAAPMERPNSLLQPSGRRCGWSQGCPAGGSAALDSICEEAIDVEFHRCLE